MIDWKSGAIPSSFKRARKYQVSFYVAFWDPKLQQFGPESRRAYIVWIDSAAANGPTYVYLPGPSDTEYRLNTKAMSHGRRWEGNWFQANREWQDFWDRTVAKPDP